VVKEGSIYRGGQPVDDEFHALKELGVKTILKLNSNNLEMEEAACEREGITLVHIAMSASTIGTESTCERVERAYEVMTDPERQPVFVHCQAGRDRTGFMIGLYRRRADGWSSDQIAEELSSYGHKTIRHRAFPQILSTLRSAAPVCAR
jgi:protein tyrosine/serine phosphatase